MFVFDFLPSPWLHCPKLSKCTFVPPWINPNNPPQYGCLFDTCSSVPRQMKIYYVKHTFDPCQISICWLFLMKNRYLFLVPTKILPFTRYIHPVLDINLSWDQIQIPCIKLHADGHVEPNEAEQARPGQARPGQGRPGQNCMLNKKVSSTAYLLKTSLMFKILACSAAMYII